MVSLAPNQNFSPVVNQNQLTLFCSTKTSSLCHKIKKVYDQDGQNVNTLTMTRPQMILKHLCSQEKIHRKSYVRVSPSHFINV